MTDETAGKARTDSNGVERGVQYPADSLERALEMLEQMRSSLGYSPADRALIANAIGFRSLSGHAARRLGSLAHYGLIERAGKGSAQISELGKAILLPTSDKERRHSIVVAAKTPNLFGALIRKYAGSAIPMMLGHVLAREHGVHAAVVEGAAKTFRDTVEFAGLLHNGVLSAEPRAPESSDLTAPPRSQEGGTAKPAGSAPGTGSASSESAPSSAAFTIALDARLGRVATIQMPIPITARDLKNVEAWAAYMKHTMHEETTPDTSAN